MSLTWFLDLGTYKDIIWDYLWSKKHLEKNLATKPTYFFFFLQIMNVQSNDVQNIWVKGPSFWGNYTFTELFTQNILDKESLKQ